MNLDLVYDGALIPSQVALSSVFKNGQFLLFHLPGQDPSIGIEVGFVLTMFVPISILTTIQKDVSLPSFEFQGTLSSYSVIEIPREYSESNYQLQCAFNSSIAVDSFQVYAVCSSITQESINQEILDLQTKVNSLQTQITQIQGEVAIIQTQVTQINATLQVITSLVQTLIGGLVAI